MGGIRRAEIVGQLAQSGVVTSTTLWVLAAASAFAWILVANGYRRCLANGSAAPAPDAPSLWP